MNTKPIDEARHTELATALVALRRARRRAERIAIANGTPLVQVVDGKPVFVFPVRRDDGAED